jgi:glycosyltransferase involved in cell wall biosynthesis
MSEADTTVSVIVPAHNEESYLSRTLSSLQSQSGTVAREILVVDGGSTDATRDVAREFGVELLEQSGTGIGAGRHEGGEHASGDWLAFVDADTRVRESYLTEMLSFVREHDLAAATSRCRVVGSYRGKAKQAVVNRVFPHLARPILPGFNFFVDADVYEETGGFPNVPNEDTAYSRELAAEYDVGYHPDCLVETSGRRFARSGLTGALTHYVRLDVGRLRAEY